MLNTPTSLQWGEWCVCDYTSHAVPKVRKHYGEMRIWGSRKLEAGICGEWFWLFLRWDVVLLMPTLASKPKLGPEWLKILPTEEKDPFTDHSWIVTGKGLWHRTKLGLSFSNPGSFYFWQTGSSAHPWICCEGEHLSPPVIPLWWHPVC